MVKDARMTTETVIDSEHIDIGACAADSQCRYCPACGGVWRHTDSGRHVCRKEHAGD